MNIRITKPARMDLDYDLIGAGLGGFPLLYFPLAVYRGDYCCFHGEDSGVISGCSRWMLEPGTRCRTECCVCGASVAKGRLDGWLCAGGEDGESSCRSTWTGEGARPHTVRDPHSWWS